MRPEATYLGPEPHLASCRGCGATLATVWLPTPLGPLLAYLRAFADEHRACAAKYSGRNAGGASVAVET